MRGVPSAPTATPQHPVSHPDPYAPRPACYSCSMARPLKREGRHPISAVAKKFKLHPQTLRLYEREGLLRPARTEGRTRIYDENDLERLEFILRMTRDLGVNLAGVQVALQYRERILQLETTFTEMLKYLSAKLPPGGAQTPGLVRWRPPARRVRTASG